MKKEPQQWLEQASPAEKNRGSFKLFLGYAPGVGKTHSMLSEGIRRRSRGEDVVIGIIETHGRKGIEELAQQLEAVPRRELGGADVVLTQCEQITCDFSSGEKRAGRARPPTRHSSSSGY